MGSVSDQQLHKPWVETPLVESKILSRAAGCRIFLKLENLQPSGSFKSRGIGNLILSYIKEHRKHGTTRPLHFYCSSGGNAGLACTVAADVLGYKSTIVVPTSTSPMMVAKLRSAGAEDVIVHGDSWKFADDHLRQDLMQAAADRGEEPIYIPPFDHPAIWTGASSMVDEITEQLPQVSKTPTSSSVAKPDAIICSVGGGGMFCGIMQGLKNHNLTPHTRVLAVETDGADSLASAVEAGEHITLPGITSIAKTLGAVRVAEQAYNYASQNSNVIPVVLDDAEACMACWRFADDERILVEPSCGVSIAPCYDGRLRQILPDLNEDSAVVVIVCGGSNVTLGLLEEYKQMFGERALAFGGGFGGRSAVGASGEERGEGETQSVSVATPKAMPGVLVKRSMRRADVPSDYTVAQAGSSGVETNA